MRFNPAVIIPTYNNAQTLSEVLEALSALKLPLFIVNDGSTDATGDVLGVWRERPQVTVLTHEQNRGKAAALRTGFAAAHQRGFTHAVTFDSDGQLNAADVSKLLEAAAQAPEALILGVRDDRAGDYPARSRRGRIVSNTFIRVECGLRVADSQCGLRVYPLELVTSIKCQAERFGFETEIITRAGWAGCELREVPVSCRYDHPDQHLSHFKPWRDSFRAVPMHARLVARAFVPWPHRKLAKAQRARQARWQELARWFSPKRAWRELREQPDGPHELATGLAVGVFIANLPVYGFQTLLSLYTARRLHLNPLVVVAGSHISTPPVGPLLIALAVGVGHVVLHGTWLRIPEWPGSFHEWLHLLGKLLAEWSVGSVIVGLLLGVLVFFVSHALLRLVAIERE
jgi:glycosyltransferase involved in cell wall biosynthesis